MKVNGRMPTQSGHMSRVTSVGGHQQKSRPPWSWGSLSLSHLKLRKSIQSRSNTAARSSGSMFNGRDVLHRKASSIVIQIAAIESNPMRWKLHIMGINLPIPYQWIQMRAHKITNRNRLPPISASTSFQFRAITRQWKLSTGPPSACTHCYAPLLTTHCPMSRCLKCFNLHVRHAFRVTICSNTHLKSNIRVVILIPVPSQIGSSPPLLEKIPQHSHMGVVPICLLILYFQPLRSI